jgi:6,7-dimethyl-8-ribityllumazine synthase
MAARAKRSADESELLGTPGSQGAHILIIEAPYYEAISAELAAGAIAELDAAHATYERIVVPGALEIPQALAQAVKADLIGSDDASARFDGCVVLGCVIRGETSHYDQVCDEVARGVARAALDSGVPVTFGVVTAESLEQAIERAGAKGGNRGWDAALAAIEMVSLLRGLE